MSQEIQLSLVIPVFNEEKIIKQSIKQIIHFLKHKYIFEVIIADNASTDSTPKLGRELERIYKQVRYFRIEAKGRGLALRKAWSTCKGKYLGFMDADLSTHLEALPRLINALNIKFDIAIGSRFLPGSIVKRSFLRKTISYGYRLFLKKTLHIHFNDAQCGFKLINRKTFNRIVPLITNNQWFFDTELLVLAEYNHLNIKEIPVVWIDKGMVNAKNRKSKVNIINTIKSYILNIIILQKKLHNEYPAFKNNN